MRVTNEPTVSDGFQAITSLSRALGGRVELTDVGSLLWVVLRQMVPCETMAVFMPSASGLHVVVRYAAGAHAEKLEGIRRPVAWGIAGWVAINRRSVVNAGAHLRPGLPRVHGARAAVVRPGPIA